LNEYIPEFFAKTWLHKERKLHDDAVRCTGESVAAHEREPSDDLMEKIVPKMANSILSVDPMIEFLMRFQAPIRIKALKIGIHACAARNYAISAA
jgi:hypothetical protein